VLWFGDWWVCRWAYGGLLLYDYTELFERDSVFILTGA
jgi:hypothetical protein